MSLSRPTALWSRVALLLFCAALGPGCSAGEPELDGGGGAVPGPVPTSVSVSAPFAVLVDEAAALVATPGAAAVALRWDFGDGSTGQAESPGTTVTATHAWGQPGTYVVTARAVHPQSATTGLNLDATAQITVQVLAKPVFAPQTSGTLAVTPDGDAVLALSEDADVVSLFTRQPGTPTTPETWALTRRMATCDRPRSLALEPGEQPTRLAVACQDSDEVWLLRLSDGAVLASHTFPWGSAPYAVLWRADGLYVTLRYRGQVARLGAKGDALALASATTVVTDARGLTHLPGGDLLVSRWRSPAQRGELARWNPSTGAVSLVPLAWADLAPADSESGGVPSYLDQVLIPPQGGEGFVPGLHANNRDGGHRNGQALAHDTATRAMVARLKLALGAGGGLDSLSEIADQKWLFEDRGLAQAGAISRRGAWLYLAMRGSRSVERFDLTRGGVQSGAILGVGYAPQGLALSPDGRWLFVDAQLSRELVVYRLAERGPLPQQPLVRLPLHDTEPLPKAVLRGKQLFNDSFDTRLADDGYIACAHCHLDGESDLRTWDFTDRGEGLRNTPSLHGRAGTGHGPVHWSANFDEIQDFEHDIRGPFGGSGLLSDADFAKANTTLGAPKAGLSAELDDLAAYVTSLSAWPRSPHAEAGGALSEAAQRGQALFQSDATGCTGCHTGPDGTDSGFVSPGQPRLHDVGTLGPGSGKRLGGALPGIDTPTVRGLWNAAPFLHDGSAPTLLAVLTTRNSGDTHGKTSHLSQGQLADLVAYLRSR